MRRRGGGEFVLLIAIVIIIIIASNRGTGFSGFFQGLQSMLQVEEQHVDPDKLDLPDSVQGIIETVEIVEGDGTDYDRDLFTSKTQRYTCNRNHDCEHTYTSIRSYSYYESEWYDWGTKTYTDPYTGLAGLSVKQTDYDHIIPLAYAYSHGANAWDADKCKRFADDPTVGVCCSARDNRAKGAKGPSEWMPDANQADYCYTWLVIASEWDLGIDQDDMDVILKVLDGVDEKELSLLNEYPKN